MDENVATDVDRTTVLFESKSMCRGAMLMYPFATLRKLAKETPEKVQDIDKILGGVERNSTEVLGGFLTATDVMDAIKSNMTLLRNEPVFSKNSKDNELLIDATLSALDDIATSTNEFSPEVKLKEFDDKFHDKELVYAVAINSDLKRVTIIFRGSAERNDWAQNKKVGLKKLTTPEWLKENGMRDSIWVHNGFHSYLFNKNERGVTKYDEIMEDLTPLIEQHPDHSVFVTGHSLGGALATLVAFQIAASKTVLATEPVTLITIASPYVGDLSFREAFHILEKHDRIMHLRITNKNDIVPTIPPYAFRGWFDLGFYKHVGINLRLVDDETPPVISYPQREASSMDEMYRGWKNSWAWNTSFSSVRAHDTKEHLRKLTSKPTSDVIEKRTIEKMYADESLVGKFVAKE